MNTQDNKQMEAEPDAPEAPIYLNNAEASVWQSGWTSGYAAAKSAASHPTVAPQGEVAIVGLEGAVRYLPHLPVGTKLYTAPQPPVAVGVENILREICEMQEKNYGNGIETHIALDDLCKRARAALAATPSEAAPAGAGEALAEMEARKDAAYLERNQVVAALAKCFPSGVARTAIEGWSEDWHGCVYIDLPTGQVSWHFHDSQAYLFDGLPPYTKPWDGHDTPEKYRRVAALAAAQPTKDE